MTRRGAVCSAQTRRPSAAAGLLALLALLACRGPSGPELAHEQIHSVLWVQTAAEYRAITIELYRLAEQRLDEALKDPHWTAALEQSGDIASLPPAVIVDVDETTLDNSPFGARLIVDDRPFSNELWKEWVTEEEADPIPGALAFARHADQRGVAVFYVTNRSAELDDHTRRNLEAAGFPIEPDASNLLSLRERDPRAPVAADAEERAESDKSGRRWQVAETHRVLLLVGDDLNDFVSCGTLEPGERRALAREYAHRWGRSWILLPNPIYGGWVSSLQGHDRELPREEVLERIRSWLDIFD